MAKKLTAFILAAIMLLTFCGCSMSSSEKYGKNDNEEDEEKEEKEDITDYLNIGYHLELDGLTIGQYNYLKEYKGPNGVFDEQKQLYSIIGEEETTDDSGKTRYNVRIRFGKEPHMGDTAITCKYYSDFINGYYSVLSLLEDDSIIITHKKTDLLVYTITESKTAVYADLLLYHTAPEVIEGTTHVIVKGLTKDQYDALAGDSDSPIASIINAKTYDITYEGTDPDGTYFIHVKLGDSVNISEVYRDYIDFMYDTLYELEVPFENIYLTETFRSSALTEE